MGAVWRSGSGAILRGEVAVQHDAEEPEEQQLLRRKGSQEMGVCVSELGAVVVHGMHELERVVVSWQSYRTELVAKLGRDSREGQWVQHGGPPAGTLSATAATLERLCHDFRAVHT